MTRTQDFERKKKFFVNYDKFCALFGDALVDEELDKLTVEQLTETVDIPTKRTTNPPYGVHEFVSEGQRYFREFHPLGGGWERMTQGQCKTYRIADKYQGLKHEAIIRPILLKLVPALRGFKLNVYEIHFYEGHNNEFYLQTGVTVQGHNCIYVPYAAVLSGDVAAIEKRNLEYLSWYCGLQKPIDNDKLTGPQVWEQLRNSPAGKRFFQRLAKMKKGIDKTPNL